MSEDAGQLIHELGTLTASDFDNMKLDANGLERLHNICDQVIALTEPSVIFPSFFRLIERLSEADLGSPGPLVHTMEMYSGRYEQHLITSVRRKPTTLSLWMVNRIANTERADQKDWIALLEFASRHPKADEPAVKQAVEFIRFQKAKLNGKNDGIIQRGNQT